MLSNSLKHSICIIGAGMSGLTTAYYLSKNPNFSIKVFEKNSNIGGRCVSDSYFNLIYDYGANFFNYSDASNAQLKENIINLIENELSL